MIAISTPLASHQWGRLSFPSTLYLRPILDLLLVKVPRQWQSEVRLGLQEALVNAAKHGNQLDPQKAVSVSFSATADCHWWIITDQGTGFRIPQHCCLPTETDLIYEMGECGRGLYILYQVFDEVRWVEHRNELHLCKRVKRWTRIPLVR
ncbi:MAG: ATP-binding protein [Leptolyngbyaceae cyanobacterium SM1_1_3]|nr:ATP-binding protein [Leptolyngbyaceae cyanobacterium SM1_1_3]NJN04205.1 ATP-binding protein [Leptolyngbyaceae cyanobacterium RM1_1_2]NJO08334.1 ATP-binding protein [Leptolyngbyaceae cyanobacterium SL_1_1]